MKRIIMKNLGKIMMLFLMAMPLFAGLSVSVDNDTITRGQRVTFTVKVTGSGEVRMPPLDTLCGYDIEGKMQSRKDVFSNGKRAQELSLIYEFMPQRSCVIEAFAVSINDVEYMTEAININVSKIAISKNDPFLVELKTDKNSVYVGEPFEMSVLFAQRNNIQAFGESISLPESKNIWIKSEHKGQGFVKKGYQNRTNMYAMSAQQSGKLNLGPLRWDLQVRSRSKDYWGSFIARSKTRTVFSNELEMEVKPLPEGITLVGELKIQAHVDKNEINAGEAVNLTIDISGAANIEDIESFSIHIDGAQAFNEDPSINHYIQDGKYFGSFIQKSALVAQKDFSVPAFELRYMDVASDTIKTIKTQDIPIKVKNSAPIVKEELNIQRPEKEPIDVNAVSRSLSVFQGFLLVLGGLVLGLIIGVIPWKRWLKKEGGQHKLAAKESKEVLQLLMTHMDVKPEIEGLVKEISENLYEGKSHSIDKKTLKRVLKELQG